MKQILGLSVVTLLLSSLTTMVWADGKDWGNYRSVERHQHQSPTRTYTYTDQYGRPMSEQVPIRPQNNRPYPNYPSHPSYPHYPEQNYPDHGYPNRPYPVYPPQNGVTIIYNHKFPTQTEYSGTSYGYVNGNGSIQSSKYTLISDWRRYGLPDPQVGMHWIFEHGRYVQISNDR